MWSNLQSRSSWSHNTFVTGRQNESFRRRPNVLKQDFLGDGLAETHVHIVRSQHSWRSGSCGQDPSANQLATVRVYQVDLEATGAHCAGAEAHGDAVVRTRDELEGDIGDKINFVVRARRKSTRPACKLVPTNHQIDSRGVANWAVNVESLPRLHDDLPNLCVSY